MLATVLSKQPSVQRLCRDGVWGRSAFLCIFFPRKLQCASRRWQQGALKALLRGNQLLIIDLEG